jgi:hypothetical protein
VLSLSVFPQVFLPSGPFLSSLTARLHVRRPESPIDHTLQHDASCFGLLSLLLRRHPLFLINAGAGSQFVTVVCFQFCLTKKKVRLEKIVMAGKRAQNHDHDKKKYHGTGIFFPSTFL